MYSRILFLGIITILIGFIESNHLSRGNRTLSRQELLRLRSRISNTNRLRPQEIPATSGVRRRTSFSSSSFTSRARSSGGEPTSGSFGGLSRGNEITRILERTPQEINRVILTPVQDGAVRSLRNILSNRRGRGNPRLIGFLIPRADGRTQLRLMRGAERFLSRRGTNRGRDSTGNRVNINALPFNLRTIVAAARRANLLPSVNGTRVRTRTPPIVVLRSPNNRGFQQSRRIATLGGRNGFRRRESESMSSSSSSSSSSSQDTTQDSGGETIKQRTVNIEVNVQSPEKPTPSPTPQNRQNVMNQQNTMINTGQQLGSQFGTSRFNQRQFESVQTQRTNTVNTNTRTRSSSRDTSSSSDSGGNINIGLGIGLGSSDTVQVTPAPQVQNNVQSSGQFNADSTGMLNQGFLTSQPVQVGMNNQFNSRFSSQVTNRFDNRPSRQQPPLSRFDQADTMSASVPLVGFNPMESSLANRINRSFRQNTGSFVETNSLTSNQNSMLPNNAFATNSILTRFGENSQRQGNGLNQNQRLSNVQNEQANNRQLNTFNQLQIATNTIQNLPNFQSAASQSVAGLSDSFQGNQQLQNTGAVQNIFNDRQNSLDVAGGIQSNSQFNQFDTSFLSTQQNNNGQLPIQNTIGAPLIIDRGGPSSVIVDNQTVSRVQSDSSRLSGVQTASSLPGVLQTQVINGQGSVTLTSDRNRGFSGGLNIADQSFENRFISSSLTSRADKSLDLQSLTNQAMAATKTNVESNSVIRNVADPMSTSSQILNTDSQNKALSKTTRTVTTDSQKLPGQVIRTKTTRTVTIKTKAVNGVPDIQGVQGTLSPVEPQMNPDIGGLTPTSLFVNTSGLFSLNGTIPLSLSGNNSSLVNSGSRLASNFTNNQQPILNLQIPLDTNQNSNFNTNMNALDPGLAPIPVPPMQSTNEQYVLQDIHQAQTALANGELSPFSSKTPMIDVQGIQTPLDINMTVVSNSTLHSMNVSHTSSTPLDSSVEVSGTSIGGSQNSIANAKQGSFPMINITDVNGMPLTSVSPINVQPAIDTAASPTVVDMPQNVVPSMPQNVAPNLPQNILPNMPPEQQNVLPNIPSEQVPNVATNGVTINTNGPINTPMNIMQRQALMNMRRLQLLQRTGNTMDPVLRSRLLQMQIAANQRNRLNRIANTLTPTQKSDLRIIENMKPGGPSLPSPSSTSPSSVAFMNVESLRSLISEVLYSFFKKNKLAPISGHTPDVKQNPAMDLTTNVSQLASMEAITGIPVILNITSAQPGASQAVELSTKKDTVLGNMKADKSLVGMISSTTPPTGTSTVQVQTTTQPAVSAYITQLKESTTQSLVTTTQPIISTTQPKSTINLIADSVGNAMSSFNVPVDNHNALFRRLPVSGIPMPPRNPGIQMSHLRNNIQNIPHPGLNVNRGTIGVVSNINVPEVVGNALSSSNTIVNTRRQLSVDPQFNLRMNSQLQDIGMIGQQAPLGRAGGLPVFPRK